MIKKRENMSFSRRVSWVIVMGRVVRYAFQNMWRNFGLAVITITILTLALVSVNALYGLRALAGAAITAVERQVDVSVFFSPRATAEQIEQVKSYIYEVAPISNSDYVSPEQALDAFRERHAGDDDIVRSLDVLEENPLGAILIVRTKDTADYKKILTALSADEFSGVIQKRSFEDRGKIVENVQLLTSRLERFSLGLAVLFACIAVLIIFNAIRIAIYTQREEITIKKLVGATNGFIRAPFLIEAFLYVAISLGATAALVSVAVRVVDPYLGPLFVGGGFSLYETFFGEWLVIFGSQFAVVLGVAWMTAAIAMRKYLRK